MADWAFVGVEPAIVERGGNVDIGTVYPASRLPVRGSIRPTGNVVFENTGCAGTFGVNPSATVEPGTVMASAGDGDISVSRQPCDRRVAGAVSGIGHAP